MTEINPFTNPLGYSLSRQQETMSLISKLSVFIKDEKIKQKTIKYIKTHRDSITDPRILFNYVGDLSGNKENTGSTDFLNKLIERSPIYRNSIVGLRKYFIYCKTLFSIAGLYSLEDEYVRLFFYTVIISNLSDRKTKTNLEEALYGILSKQKSKNFAKRLLGVSKDTQKALVFLLYSTRTPALRTFHSIGKELNIDDETARKYFEEVKNMPKDERIAFLKAVTPNELNKYGRHKHFSEAEANAKVNTSQTRQKKDYYEEDPNSDFEN